MTFSLTALVEHVFTTQFCTPCDALDGEVAIPYVWTPGDPDSKLLLVLGENAGGKSLFRRLFIELTRRGREASFGQKEVKPSRFPLHEVIHLSMEGRAGTDMNPIRQQMVYGGEEWMSTGSLTASLITKGIKTAKGREHETSLYWDEPCVGMSACCQMGAGITVREFVDNLDLAANEHIVAVVITSHSPWFVDQLLGCHERPHYLYLGSFAGPSTIEEWVEGERTPVVPIDPEMLDRLSHERFEMVRTILHGKKKVARG